jgi:hypothetical protein
MSARSKPVMSTTAPAVAASEAKRSVSRARGRLDARERPALPRAIAAATLAHAPSRPTASTTPPSLGTDHRRLIASTAMTPASTSSVARLGGEDPCARARR